MASGIDIDVILSGASFLFTSYFWLVKSNREKPCLEFFQLSHFQASCRKQQGMAPGKKRLCLQQRETGGVLIVNHSTRQNSVVLFECFLKTDRGEIRGDWGYTGDDKPPWNIGPESSIAFSPACFFDVPEDYETPDNPQFRIDFITASGILFSHDFTRLAPQIGTASQTTTARAA